jgi:TPR repeat protein
MLLNFSKGAIGRRSYDKAIEWLTASANQGFLHAQALLGNNVTYLVFNRNAGELNEFPAQEGKSDIKKAIQYYEKAAEGGDLNSSCALALHYYYGTGLPTNQKKAIDMLNKAATQGIFKLKYYVYPFFQGIHCLYCYFTCLHK